MASVTLAPPLAPLAAPNQYGNPYSEQDAYGMNVRARSVEYAPPVALHSPRLPHAPQGLADPNTYNDPGSYSDTANGPSSFQDSMPYVPTLEDYAEHGFYEHPEKTRRDLIRKREGRQYEMNDPLYAEQVRKDANINDAEMEGGMAYGDRQDLQRRYGLMPAANHAEEVDWDGYNSNLFNVTPKLGPVKSMFFSRENIRRLGDYFDSRGLGRPSAENMREYMQLVWADNPDFLFDWRRDANSAKMQLQRLNSLLMADMVPILTSARDSWKKYQYDAYFGWGWQLIDNPVNTSTKRNANSLEFNNRLY